MKSIEEIREILHQQKPWLSNKYGVIRLELFGSFVRGEQKEGSDLDILVELKKPFSIDLIAFIEMENYLSDLLGVKVDLVMKEDLKPGIGEHILNEAIEI